MTSLATRRSAPRVKLDRVEADGRIAGYGSIFNEIDSYGDVVLPGAFAASLKARFGADGTRPKLLREHDPGHVIGVWERMVEDERGLWCEGRLILEVEKAAETYALLKAGALDGLSIGYECSEASYCDRSEFEAKYGVMPMGMSGGTSQVRALSKIDLWEGSVLTFPACTPAVIEEVKRAGGPDLVAISKALAERRRALERISV